MAVRGEDVTKSIETHIRKSVERMVGELRSSLEDIRKAVDSQLKAAMQSVQADANSFSLPPEVGKSIGEFEQSFKSSAPSAPQAAGAAADAGRLKTAIQNVEQARSQVDVLNALLEQCLLFGSRAALLILKGDSFAGWKGVGFTAQGGNDEAIKRFTATPGMVGELDTLLRRETVIRWDGKSLATRFGVSAPAAALLVPMVIKDKVAAAVYVDATSSDVARLDQPSIEVLVFTTGLLIDTLAIRKKTPSPSLSSGKPASGAQPQAAAPAPAPPSRTASRPTMSGTTATPSRPTATVAIQAQQVQEALGTAGPAMTFTPSSPARTPTPPPTRPAAPFARPAAPPAEGERASTQYVPPAGVARGGAFGSGQSEEAKKHDEARRFARLLVSEIKLYNEAKVDQGRKNRDLYERMKEDIDRSRQMYDERIGDDVRKVSNYFYDELVRILADGNAEALGL